MDDVFSESATRKWSMYVAYWAGYVLLLSFVQGFAASDILTSFYNELFSLLPKVVFVLIIVEWLMDALFLKKRILAFISIYLLMLLVFAFIQRLVDNYIILTYFLTHWTKESLLSTAPYLYNIIKLQFVVTVPFSIKLFYYWAEEKNRVQTIGAEKMRAELYFMRNQFQPHFMFNVLNSLYSKVLTKSDDAAEMVLSISSLLRFSVYEVNDKTITLEKEIDYIRNYISLQQVRYDKKLQLSISVTGVISDKFIEPFLLLPFIENGIKFSMEDELAGGWVIIFISVQDDWLTLKVDNSVSQKKDTNEKERSLNNGFGLANVKRRLELLYPDTHVLKITDSGDSFFVVLKVKLYDVAR